MRRYHYTGLDPKPDRQPALNIAATHAAFLSSRAAALLIGVAIAQRRAIWGATVFREPRAARLVELRGGTGDGT